MTGQKESKANDFDNDDVTKNVDIHVFQPNDLINSSENIKIMSATTEQSIDFDKNDISSEANNNKVL